MGFFENIIRFNNLFHILSNIVIIFKPVMNGDKVTMMPTNIVVLTMVPDRIFPVFS